MAQRSSGKKKTTRNSTATTKKATYRKKTAASAKKVASSTKLPRVGQTVVWRALPGEVEGKVVAILKADTELNGKKVKASPDAPRIKLRSTASGKICVHRPENVHVRT